jgi:integrase
MPPRRRFGNVRRLPSGKWQASYLGPDGERHTGDVTFPTEVDAERYLAMTARQIRSGEWTDLRQLGRRTLRDCCEAYLDENPRVGRRWAETCRRNMRLHLSDLLDLPIAQIHPPTVRAWYAKQRRLGKSPSGTAQSYRFIRSVLNVAVADEAIPRNPCVIPGAGTLKAAERPTATPEQVAQLIEAITPRYRAAVVLAAWCGLRRGEVCALRVTDVNLEEGTVHVHKNWVELLQAPVRFEKDPKTEAGKRTVNIPPHVIPILVEHQRLYAGPEFFNIGLDGRRARGDTIYQAFVRAREEVGIDMTFHDLRHTGQTMAAAAGANLADLMRRLGHSSSVAALRYLHAVEGRDKEIAQNLSRMAQTHSLTHLYPPPSTRPPSGPSI